MGNARSEDTAALKTRLRLNRGRGRFRLGSWIAERVGLDCESRLLDVGCGSGETLLDFSTAIDDTGLRCGVDASPESVLAAADAARARGMALSLYEMEMDELAEERARPELSDLTHITSVYALYYSTNAGRLIGALARRLRREGRLTVVGPAPGNNTEWFGFLDDHGVAVPEQVRAVSESFPGEVLTAANRAFHEVTAHVELNRVALRSAGELCDYWRANVYHNSADDARFDEAARDWFAFHREFPITKRIGLTQCQRPR